MSVKWTHSRLSESTSLTNVDIFTQSTQASLKILKSVLGEWDTRVSDLVFLTRLSPYSLQGTIKANIKRLGDVGRVR